MLEQIVQIKLVVIHCRTLDREHDGKTVILWNTKMPHIKYLLDHNGWWGVKDREHTTSSYLSIPCTARQAYGSRADTRREMVSEPKTLTGAKQVLTYTVLGHTITRKLPACHPLQSFSGVCHGSLSISLWNNRITLIHAAVSLEKMTIAEPVNTSHAFQWNSKLYYRTPPMASILSQTQPVHISQPVSLMSILIRRSPLQRCFGRPWRLRFIMIT